MGMAFNTLHEPASFWQPRVPSVACRMLCVLTPIGPEVPLSVAQRCLPDQDPIGENTLSIGYYRANTKYIRPCMSLAERPFPCPTTYRYGLIESSARSPPWLRRLPRAQSLR